MARYNACMSATESTSAPTRLTNQTLLIDADDTLWENNIYFEEAIASFISDLDHKTHSPQKIREHLNRCERSTIAAQGYGIQSFRQSLVDCLEQLTESRITPEQYSRILSFTAASPGKKIQLLSGVVETLRLLRQRHRLILVTKGDPREQTDKLERSRLQAFFSAVEIPAEKSAAAYRSVIQRHQCDPCATWMIGNSPKSDINPALAAGLHAVFIPHACTWILEHEEVDPPSGLTRLLKLDSFPELLTYF